MEHVNEVDPPETVTRVPEDRLVEAVADERRRSVLAYLRGESTPVSLAVLASRIAEWEATPAENGFQVNQEVVHHSLHHCHVPKLADADVVEYDREERTVTQGAAFERAVELLDALPNVDDPEAV